MKWEDGDLDDIEVRYIVETTFEVHGRDGMHGCADASFSMSCGTYSGVPDRKNMADLISSRTVDADDIDEVVGDFVDVEFISDLVSTRCVRPEEIRSMTIEAVLFRERPIAESIYEEES